MPVDQPLTAAEVGPLFAPLAGARMVLLAVSGGPDSTALMRLAAPAQNRPAALAVAVVDHGLRPGSRDTAERVVAGAATLGLPAQILTWQGRKPATRLQERARLNRYALLVAHARDIGASHFATAHTLDDQAETVLFRMMRGSGPEGLAGMRPACRRDGLIHLRPFLGVAKARLVATCRAAGWTFETDPANADPRFARARLRRLMPALAEEGLDASCLARLARRLGEADAVVLGAARGALAEADEGQGAYRAKPLVEAPAAVLHRALDVVLAALAGTGRPRLERLERYGADLVAAAAARVPLRRTLHGALLDFDGAGRLVISPEPARRQPRSGPAA